MTPEAALKALSQVIHPELGRDLVTLGMIGPIEERQGKLHLPIDLLTHGHPRREEVLQAVAQAVPEAVVEVSVTQRSTQPPLGSPILSSVKNIVAIASGKGGVGKSTVASNVAASLAMEGARVGLMDADIYGPSIPALLGLENSPLKIQDKQIVPVEKFGLKIMSMGFLMRPGESVIWRGPMLHGMVNQFCKDVVWGDLDFLVIDLPPGTGDVSLSLCQLVPLGGAVLVSTPQDVALGVATKAVNMFRKLNVPLIGLVENMSYYACPHCHQRDDLFGHGGARQAAQDMGLPFLGEVPLNSSIRLAGDQGQPVVVADPESSPALAFRSLTRSLAGKLAMAAVLGYEAVLGEMAAT